MLKNRIAGLEVIAVEPEASAVLSGKAPDPIRFKELVLVYPQSTEYRIIDRIIPVTDVDALATSRRLARKKVFWWGFLPGQLHLPP